MLILRKLQNCKSENDDKRIQSIDSIETYAYGMSKDLVSTKEESRYYKRKHKRAYSKLVTNS